MLRTSAPLIATLGGSEMTPLRYASGEEVRLGDVVDVGKGHGPRMEVVVIISSLEAAEGFDPTAWAYLKNGIVSARYQGVRVIAP